MYKLGMFMVNMAPDVRALSLKSMDADVYNVLLNNEVVTSSPCTLELTMPHKGLETCHIKAWRQG